MEILRTIVIVCIIVVESRSENNPLISQQCKHEDKICIANLCNVFFKSSGNGIPEVGLVPTNPYEISNVIVETGEKRPINLKIQFKRANITGIHTFHIDKVVGFDKDPRTSRFEMFGSVERASISGPYRISGKFLLLPISGNGHSNLIFENMKLRVQLKCGVETRNGKDHLILKKVLIKMEPEKLRVHFENLFNNKELSDSMNAALNENADLLFQELQVPIQNVVGDAMKEIFAPINEVLAYSDFFSKDD